MRASKLTLCSDTRVYHETHAIGLANNRNEDYDVSAEVSLNTFKSDYGSNTTFNSIDNKLYNIDHIDIELIYRCYEDSYAFGKIRLKPIIDTKTIHITTVALSEYTFARLVYKFKELIEIKAQGEQAAVNIVRILKQIIYCLLDDEAQRKYNEKDILVLVGGVISMFSNIENRKAVFDCPILEEKPHLNYLSPIYGNYFSEKDIEEYNKGINFNLASKSDQSVGTAIKAKKDE